MWNAFDSCFVVVMDVRVRRTSKIATLVGIKQLAILGFSGASRHRSCSRLLQQQDVL